VTLLLTFAVVTATVVALLWATAAFVQPYLFGQPVDKLGVRSLISGVLVGGFVAFWTYLNAGAVPEDKFGVIYQFNPTARTEVESFDAVRLLRSKGADGKNKEQTVGFRRVPGTEPPQFVEATDPARKFQVNSDNYMTVALLVPLGGNGEKVRFDAVLKDGAYSTEEDGYREVGGGRYIERRETPSPVNVPNRGAIIGALFLNFMAFGVWLIVFAPLLKYGGGLSLGLATACGLFMLLVVMPLAFKENKPAAPGAAPVAVAPAAG
jgi:hypothetical protein